MSPNSKVSYGAAAAAAVGAATTFAAGASPSATPYTSGGMTMSAPPKILNSTEATGAIPVTAALLTATVEAVEARTETKFAQLLGKLDLIGERISGLSGEITGLKGQVTTIDGHTRSARTAIIAAIIGTAVALSALAWAGVQIFQGGMGASAIAFQSGLAVNGGSHENPQTSPRAGQVGRVHR